MCNRFRSLREFSELPRYFQTGPLLNFEFNPNVCPTESVPAWLTDKGKPPTARMARFGIEVQLPNPHPVMNLRMDRLKRGPFSSLVSRRRCIVPAAGFYEWREEKGVKQPYYFYRKDGKPIQFAALWDESDRKGDVGPSFALLTDEPNAVIEQFHDRMPVILDDEGAEAWIGFSTSLADLRPLPEDHFAVRPVDRAVNYPGCKDLGAIEPNG